MPILNGTISACCYRTDTTCPPDARERYNRALQRHAFRPIDAEKGETQSAGWVDPRNILASPLTWDRLSVGPYVFLGLRVDKKSVPGPLLKARLRQALREVAKEKKTTRISRTEKKAIEEQVTADLLRQASPSVAIYEASWNTATGELLIAATSKGVNEGFMEVFAHTFEMELEPAHPLARSTELAARAGHPEGLGDIRESHWGKGARIAAIHNLESVGEGGD